MPDDDHGADRVIQIALSEFTALRKEISDRSSAAQLLMNLNITATGTVAGLVLSDKADPLLLLLLPVLSPALGMLYVDHGYNIVRLGNYINEKLKPALNKMVGASGLLAYEEWVDEYEQRKLLRFLPFFLPVTIIFLLAPMAGLIFTFSSLQDLWAWVLWASGLLLTLCYLVLWAAFLVMPYIASVVARPKG